MLFSIPATVPATSPRIEMIEFNATNYRGNKAFNDSFRLLPKQMYSTEIAWKDHIDIGDIRYHLNLPLYGTVFPFSDIGFEVNMDFLSPEFSGIGSTIKNAEKNLIDNIHEEFQKLYSMHPLQMNENELKKWERLQYVIDVGKYIQDTPIESKEMGRVFRCINDRKTGRIIYKIKWVEGGFDDVEIENICTDIIRKRNSNRYFEAYVLRKYSDNTVLKIQSATFTSIPNWKSRKDIRQFWEKLKKGKTLPDFDYA